MVERKSEGIPPLDTRRERDCMICGERTDRNAWICAFCQQQFAEEEEAELRHWGASQDPGQRK